MSAGSSEIFDGFLAPVPLLKPEAWPQRSASDQRPWLLSLDLFLQHSGPLVEHLKAIAKSGPVIWWAGDSSLIEEATQVLKDISPNPVFWSELQHKWPVQLKPEAWLPILFPETLAAFGELKMRSLLRDYQNEMSRTRVTENEFPLKSLGYFTLFVRQQGDAVLTELVLREWLRSSVFLSPQTARPKVAAGLLKLNPTLETLTFNADKSRGGVWAFFRDRNDELQEKKLGWQEALVLDEFYEHSQHSVTTLMVHLKPAELQARKHGLKDDRSLEETIEHLVAAGLMIRASST